MAAIGWSTDEDWIRVRRAQWKRVKEELEQAHYFRSKEISQMREYFLHGTRASNYEYYNYSGPLPLLFRAWFHPELNDALWQEMLAESLSSDLEFCRELTQVAIGAIPPRSFDALAPRFYNLFFLQPTGPLEAPYRRGAKLERIRPVLYGPEPAIFEFAHWCAQDEPCVNPRCRFLIHCAADVSEASLITLRERSAEQNRSFITRWVHLCSAPDDPRSETARKLMEMTQTLGNLRILLDLVEQFRDPP